MTIADEDRMHQFKRGSIIRIELVNFMIYDHVIFEPGPFLNLILGPNGSGKSAIVCSIIMGFGGDPQITGRSANLIDYVRFGSLVACITIEVFSGDIDEPNMVIQRNMRVVSKNNKNDCVTSWKLNGKAVNKAEIGAFIKSLNIEINNLCQVLPQERVVEFSRLSPKELLLSTEKSIGDVNLYENHMKLIAMSKEAAEIDQKIKNCNSFILKYQNFKSNIEPDLMLIKQKKKFEEEIEWLEKKKAMAEYEQKRLSYVEKKQLYVEKKQLLDHASEKLKPIQEYIGSCDAFSKNLQSQRDRSANVFRQANLTIKDLNKRMEAIAGVIEEKIEHYNQMVAQQSSIKKRIADYEQHLANFQNDRQNFSDQGQFESQLEIYKKELTEIEQKIKNLSKEIFVKRNRLDELEAEQRLLNAQKSRLTNLFNRRLERIEAQDPNVRIACDWFEKNRSMFSGEVYPPIITQINVNRPEHVRFVESCISFNDLCTFLFEKKEDLTAFTQKLHRDHQIRAAVAMLPRDITINDCDRTFDLDRFKMYGIFASVRDLFTAPDKVMAYLCKSNHLHRIPIGNDKTDDTVQALIDSSPFRRIITSNNMYNIIVSSYDQKKTTRIVKLNEPRFLNIITDRRQIDENRIKLEKIVSTIAEMTASLEVDAKNNAELKQLFEHKQDQYDANKSQRDAIALIEAKIAEKKRQIEKLQASLGSLEQVFNETANFLAKKHVDQLKLVEELSTKLTAFNDLNSTDVIIGAKLEMINQVRSHYNSLQSDINRELTDMQNEFRAMTDELRTARDEAKAARERAREISGFDFSDSELDSEIREKLNSLPNTIDEMNNAIKVLQLRCQGFADIDESIIEQHRQYLQQIAEKTAECNQLEIAMNEKLQQIATTRQIWSDSLEGLVSQININFGQFMEHLGNSGEVYLANSGKENTYDEYGIRIKVKFRDSEPMKDLDAFYQSGGERSVSTMIYMLSLQELANVPFRVVDEINQGMDEKNERCVFDLISEVSRRNSSQYFLLSPKLLFNLNYTPEMKVHIIFNGPKVFIDWHKVLPQLMNKKANDESEIIGEEDEEEEEIGEESMDTTG